jgi:hypothetical protein
VVTVTRYVVIFTRYVVTVTASDLLSFPAHV